MSNRAYAESQAQQKMLLGSSPKSSLLLRSCACGESPGIDGLCTECRDKRLTSQSSQRGFEDSSVSAVTQGNSSPQESGSAHDSMMDRASHFGHDFSQIPIHALAESSNEMSEVRKGKNGPKSPEATAPKPDTNPKPSVPKPAPKPELKPEEAKKPSKPTITHETTFPAPDGTDKKRTNVGVGEEVTFTGSAVGKWTATDGTPRELANGAKFTWTAPNRAATVTIKLQVGTEEATVSMKVIEPASITAHKNSEIAFAAGTAGAGMKLTLIYHPLNVSFGNVETKEVSGPATNITGYYKKHFSDADLRHNSGDTFFPIQENNKDSVEDTASDEEHVMPFEKGTFDWVIPNKFKVKTEAGDGKQYTHVTQAFLMVDATGKIKITKAGAEVERSP